MVFIQSTGLPVLKEIHLDRNPLKILEERSFLHTPILSELSLTLLPARPDAEIRNNVILPPGGDKYINLNTSLPSSGLHNVTYIMLHQSRVDLTGIPALFSRLGALQEVCTESLNKEVDVISARLQNQTELI